MLLSLLIAGLFVFLLFNLARNYYTPGLEGIPGPFLARLSDWWRFIDACTGQHPRTIVDLHRQYGKVVRIGAKVVSVADPDAIESILGLKANLDKSDSVKPMMNPYEGQQLPMLISAIDSKLHAQIKRPVAGTYSMTSMLKFEALMDDNIAKLVRRLKETFIRPGSPSCLISEWMSFFSFDFILQATFSKNFGFLDTGKDIDSMVWMLDLQLMYIGVIGVMPWIDHLLLKNPVLLMLVSTPNKLVDFASEGVRKRKRAVAQATQEAKEQDFLSLFLLAQQQHPQTVSDLQVTTYAATNVLAASDTTSAALTAILYHLLKHPSVLEKLQSEVDGAKISNPISYREASQLKYLDVVIREVLRFFPPAAIDLERKVGETGLVLPSGHRLPPGTIVGVNPCSVSRDVAVFGDNADVFEPERWLQGPEESIEAFDERLRVMQRTSIAFGAGPRACLGKNMAVIQLYKVIPTLVQHFDMIIEDPSLPLRTWTGVSVKILDFRVFLRERDTYVGSERQKMQEKL